MIRIASIEDNDQEEKILRTHLDRWSNDRSLDIDLVWFKSAVEFISQQAPFDIILMDIDLPGVNGMEAATLLRTYDEETPLIFVTNLAQYAVKGYEVNALDFIVKPVGYHSLSVRMDKAMRQIERKQGKNIAIFTRDNVRVISTADLAYVDVANHDLIYHIMANGETENVNVRATLKSAEKDLDPAWFTRISNNCIINMNYVKRIQGDTLYMKGGETLYFSRSRKKLAIEALAAFLGGSL